MRVVQRFDCLQFNQKPVLDQEVGKVLADDRAVVMHPDGGLLHDGEAGSKKFKRQGILIDLVQESCAERIEHRECTADDTSRQVVQPVSICVFGVHLPTFAFEYFLSRCRPTGGYGSVEREARNDRSEPLSSGTSSFASEQWGAAT